MSGQFYYIIIYSFYILILLLLRTLKDFLDWDRFVSGTIRPPFLKIKSLQNFLEKIGIWVLNLWTFLVFFSLLQISLEPLMFPTQCCAKTEWLYCLPFSLSISFYLFLLSRSLTLSSNTRTHKHTVPLSLSRTSSLSLSFSFYLFLSYSYLWYVYNFSVSLYSFFSLLSCPLLV